MLMKPPPTPFLKIFPLALFCCGQAFQLQAEEPVMSKDSEVVKLQSSAIREASGLTESRRHRGCLWLVNDSGADAVLHLAGSKGEDLGRVTVAEAENKDWEDLAGFKLNDRPYLLVADTGDNAAKREFVTLYFLAEPEFSPDKKLEGSVKVEWSVRFRYPDGPRDCESVAVDARQQKVILVSKRTHPPEVYELPLKPGGTDVVEARKIGTTDVSNPGSLPSHLFDGQPTAMDITSDGNEAAILTYTGIFLFARKENESWAEALAHKPQVLAPHKLPQAEALAFTADGKTLYGTSEGVGAKLVKYQSP